MATISETKTFAVAAKQLRTRTWDTQALTLVIPSDGSGSYMKQSDYGVSSAVGYLPGVNQLTTTSYGTRQCKRLSDIRELRRGRVILPDLSYTWSKYERYPGRLTYAGNLLKVGTSAYEYRATSRSWDSEYWSGSTHVQTSAITSLIVLNQKLLAKAKGEVWSMPVFFAEARKTTDMVVSRAADMVRLVRQLRRGDADGFLRGLRATLSTSERSALKRVYNRDYGRGDASKAAANLWLETTYGWTPFMMDVYQGMETLSEVQSDQRNLVGTVRASVKAEGNGSAQTSITSPFVGTRTTFYEYRESRRGVWRFKPRLETYMLGKLGITNPLQVAWELLPFSFVADWFLPIGDYLEVLDAPLLMQHVGGTHGLRRETYATRVYKSTDLRGNGIGSWTYTSVDRNPYTAIPDVDMSLLTFNAKLGAKRVASAAALLRQVLSFR